MHWLVDTREDYKVMTWQEKLLTRIHRELERKGCIRLLVTVDKDGSLNIEEIGKVERIIK